MKNVSLLTFFIFWLTAGDLQAEKISPGNCHAYQTEANTIHFQCDNITASLKICSPTLLKVQLIPHTDSISQQKSFAVTNEEIQPIPSIRVEDQPACYEIHIGSLRIRVNKTPFQLQVFDKWQKLLVSSLPENTYQRDSLTQICSFALRHDEQIIGLGEKNGSLNRRGQTFKMWNSDKACYSVNDDPLYKSIPFFMSSYNYGIFFDNTYKTEFDFGATTPDRYSFSTPGGIMQYYIICGSDYKNIIRQYTQLTGHPIMPPKWAFGFAQSRGLYVKEKQALEVASEFRKRKIPCDIIYQDIGWTHGLMSFDWNKYTYTNPKEMLQMLNKQGFKMILSQDPVISQTTRSQWEEADQLGYFATDIRTGKSYDMPWPWGGNCGVVDFTNPVVADWWGNLQQKPIQDGVSGFWTDMGELAWSNEDDTDRLNMKHHLGMHEEIHNVYGLLWDKVVKEQFEKHNPDKRIFQMTRAAYAGLQRYTFGWSGDAGNGHNVLDGWRNLESQIPLALSAGMGLIPFWATDISGYCGDITDYQAFNELYVRWMQFGVLNPLSRAHHEGDNAVEPWLFGEETERIARETIALKYRLFPYIYTYAREAHDTGMPLMRALILEYPHDKETYQVNDQYLFGAELMVAPVVKKGAVSRTVYLPEGEWIDFYNNQTVLTGGVSVNHPAPLDKIPLFVRKGSIIPMMPVMQYIHEQESYPVDFHIYPAGQNQTAEFTLYEDEGCNQDYLKNIYCKTKITCQTQQDGFLITIHAPENTGYTPAERNWVIRLNIPVCPRQITSNNQKIKKTSGSDMDKKITTEYQTTGWNWNEKEKKCTIKIPAGKETTTVFVSVKP